MKRHIFLRFITVIILWGLMFAGTTGCSLPLGEAATLKSSAGLEIETPDRLPTEPVETSAVVSTVPAVDNTDTKPEEPAGQKLALLISTHLNSEYAIENIPEIKDCLKQLENIPDNAVKNPFYWYVKGLIMQNDGNINAAADCMKKAAQVAPNNRDISIWLNIFASGTDVQVNKNFLLNTGELGFKGGSFNLIDGTLWADDHTLLVTVNKGNEADVGQVLLSVDTDTMQSRQIYEGKLSGIDCVSPDGKYVLLYDRGLRYVSIETGDSILISTKGRDAALSPDGKNIAYCADGLWIYDIADGSNKKLDSGRDNACPIWFPDGKSLLFIGDLGGEELEGGAGHLQGIFRIPSDNSGKKERIDEAWQGKFHFIKWITDGEVFHAEEGWNEGFKSVAYYLYIDYRKQLGSSENGQNLEYRPGKAESIYISNDRGGISRMDIDGRLQARFEYGNVWGSAFGFPVKKIEAVQGSNSLLMYYSTPFEKATHVCITDPGFENTVFIADIPSDSAIGAVVNGNVSKAVFSSGTDKLLVAYLK